MRTATTVLLMALSLYGCRAINRLGTGYAFRDLERRNARARKQYQEIVAGYARNGQLLGTWVRSEGAPQKDPMLLDRTLTLSRTSSFVEQTVPHGHIGCVGITRGKWEKRGPGTVSLTWVDATWQDIDLRDWTNIFVRANADLMGE